MARFEGIYANLLTALTSDGNGREPTSSCHAEHGLL